MQMAIIFAAENNIELLKRGASYLEAHGVSDARAEADILLAYVLGTHRDQLYLNREQKPSEQELQQYVQLLERRGQREPLAYILKIREFMGLNFYVDQRVLIPRPETELLVEKALEICGNLDRAREIKILDLCTGSGALAVAMAYYFPSALVTAVDISAEALAVAQENAHRMGVRIDFRQGDLFEPVQREKYQVILSNPPYVSTEEYVQCSPEVRQEPALALLGGEDGLDYYRRIAAEAYEYLCSGGTIILEIGNTQGLQVAGFFKDLGYRTAILPDYAGWDRIVLAQKE